MGDKLTARKVVMAKVQAAKGTPEALDPAQDAVLTLNGAVVTPEGEAIGDERLSLSLSKLPHRPGVPTMGFSYPCELRGGGVVGNAVNRPDFNGMLRACAQSESAVVFVACDSVTGTFEDGEEITGGTSSATGTLIAYVNKGGVGGALLEDVTGTFVAGETLTGGTSGATATASAADPITGWQYMPQSTPDDMDVCTIVMNEDGSDFKGYDCQGDYAIALDAKQPGKITFTIQGRYVDPADASAPDATLNQALPPLFVNAGLKLGDFAPAGVTSVSLGMGNNVVQDTDVNASDGLAGFLITDRAPSGSLDPKADDLATFNPYSAWKSGTLALLDMLVGQEAGNRIYIRCPSIQYTDAPSRGDREKRVVYGLNFQPKGVAGDDEIRLVFF